MISVIVVECGNDEQLMKLIGLPKKRIQHEANRDEVVKYVLKKDPGFCIGVVDEDPGTARGKQRAQFKAAKANADMHMEFADTRTLVVLHPMLEGWLIKAVHACGGSMEKLDKGLSDDPNTLHKVLQPKGDVRLKKIVDFLKKHNSKHLHELKVNLGLGSGPKKTK